MGKQQAVRESGISSDFIRVGKGLDQLCTVGWQKFRVFVTDMLLPLICQFHFGVKVKAGKRGHDSPWNSRWREEWNGSADCGSTVFFRNTD